MEMRPLTRGEVELIWTIDRGELIENVYMLLDGELVPRPEHFDVQGWPPGESEKYTPLLYACYDRRGAFTGVFDGKRLAGIAVVDTRLLGPRRDLLQLKMLHVSRTYRKQGIGTRLFAHAQDIARMRGACGLYISATPSQNTIDFYRRFGAVVTAAPDPELYALEPDDIHLECPV